MNHDSPLEIKQILSSSGIALKKRWGQNFLINPQVRERIVKLVDPKAGETIWEIGPGLGAMTGALLDHGSRVIAFEIDWGMIRHLESALAAYKNLTIIQGDVIKTWPAAREQYGIPDKVMGNLPYASASGIVVSFIEKECIPGNIVFTVQRELGSRMAASPGTKDYSSFSILFQYAFSVREKWDVKPGSFFPQPEVVSTVIHAAPSGYELDSKIRACFLSLIRAGFRSRRKTLVNNLSSDSRFGCIPPGVMEAALISLGFNARTRGEELSVDDFISLADRLAHEPDSRGQVSS